MKNITITICLLLLAGIKTSFAQADNFEETRTKFILDYLQLTQEESQKFWPLYNQYRNDYKALRKSFKNTSKDDANYVDNKMKFAQQKLDLQKEYRPKIEGVIGADKYAKLLKAEEEFKATLLKKLHEQRGHRD